MHKSRNRPEGRRSGQDGNLVTDEASQKVKEDKMALTLKAARVNKGLTQKEAAKLLGISVTALLNYERGNSFPNVLMLKKIEDLYGVPYADILFLVESTVKQ